jgi:hypothetical protein
MRFRVGSILTVLIAAALSIATAAWARTFTFRATSIVPGATGEVEAKTDKTGHNVALTIKVDRLARPTLLTPRANEYVVWIQPQNGLPHNVGVLRVSDDGKGDLKTTTQSGHFTVLITAEMSPQPLAHSDRVVMLSDVQQ